MEGNSDLGFEESLLLFLPVGRQVRSWHISFIVSKLNLVVK